MLKTHVADYDKKVDFGIYKDGYTKAVERARSLAKLADSIGEPGRNPTTGVYELTEKIIPPPKKPEPAAVPGPPEHGSAIQPEIKLPDI